MIPRSAWMAMLAAALVLMTGTLMAAVARAEDTVCAAPMASGKDGFCYPAIELRGDLAEIFTVSECQWISGMTCRIAYNGKKPLPSEVFFQEVDAKGEGRVPRPRLIYPHLSAGERGTATFRVHSTPVRIVLEGVWKGPRRDPY